MIYFIQDTSVLNIKIGFTGGNPEDRRAALQTGSPIGLVLLGTTPGGKEKEAELHQRFASARVHGEWFKPVPELLQFIINDVSLTNALELHHKNGLGRLPRTEPWPLNIYLAGKIARNNWRSAIVDKLEERFVSRSDHAWGNVDEILNSEWPVMQKSIFKTHNYVGPYFTSFYDDPECYPHTGRTVGSGEDDHGIDLNGFENKISSNHQPKRDIAERCMEAIDNADLVFAWIDSNDCYGTVAEIGYATARKKMVYVTGPRHFRDMWFVYELGDFFPGDFWFVEEGQYQKPAECLHDLLEAYEQSRAGSQVVG